LLKVPAADYDYRGSWLHFGLVKILKHM